VYQEKMNARPTRKSTVNGLQLRDEQEREEKEKGAFGARKFGHGS
jgi:hypothetical protein